MSGCYRDGFSYFTLTNERVFTSLIYCLWSATMISRRYNKLVFNIFSFFIMSEYRSDFYFRYSMAAGCRQYFIFSFFQIYNLPFGIKY